MNQHATFTFYHPQTKLGQGNTFRSMCQEFCPRGGVSRPTPRGGRLRVWPGGLPGSPPVGGSPGPNPGGWGGCIPACNEADTPPSRQLLLWAVHILLESILVTLVTPVCDSAHGGGLCPGGLCPGVSLSGVVSVTVRWKSRRCTSY